MDLITAGTRPATAGADRLALLERVREVVSVYLACARLTAETLYEDGVRDAAEAIAGRRDDLPAEVEALLRRRPDAAGQAIAPLLADCETRLDEIRTELVEEVFGAGDASRF